MKHRINLPVLLHQIYLHPPEKFLPDKENEVQSENRVFQAFNPEMKLFYKNY